MGTYILIVIITLVVGFVVGYIYAKPHYVGDLIKTPNTGDWGNLYFVEFNSEEERAKVDERKEIRLKVKLS